MWHPLQMSFCLQWAAMGGSGPKGDRPLDLELVLRSKQGEDAKVTVFRDVVISCKGQVWKGSTPMVGSGGAGIAWHGCGFNEGTCVWNSDVSRVSKKEYCLRGGACIPHGPGPSEKHSRRCREKTELECIDDPEIVAGPLEAIVVLTQPQWGEYYHFLIDGLSRITWIRQQHPELLNDNTTFFHTGMVSEVGQAWARLVGIATTGDKDNRLLDGWWRAKTVYFPPSNGCAQRQVGGADPIALREMQKVVQESIRNHIPKLPPLPQPRAASAWLRSVGPQPQVALVVLRDPRKNWFRQTVNQDQVVEEVRRILRDWAVDVFSDYPSVPDVLISCGMFFRADLIIAPHGAGLANLICARTGTPVIEVQQKPHAVDYELLATKLGLPYVGMPTDTAHYRNFNISIPELHKVVLDGLHLVPLTTTSAAPTAIAAPTTMAAPATTAEPAGSAENRTATHGLRETRASEVSQVLGFASVLQSEQLAPLISLASGPALAFGLFAMGVLLGRMSLSRWAACVCPAGRSSGS